ncbi:hypothetical protein DEU56DRAFT_585205 [Suillus clintonianus]|uniref:uncharacterized protein n=1 Tax=Suillus clintonianus TaxID=1904413 RepID=UPI001B87A857|nr:uncharacterized protein DEU56DRAFT_585205 [Suillus clintonianus]KAG2125110.1 hypothetical protein DEU56DRAFT_585205 [Suillus clintonianus]
MSNTSATGTHLYLHKEPRHLVVLLPPHLSLPLHLIAGTLPQGTHHPFPPSLSSPERSTIGLDGCSTPPRANTLDRLRSGPRDAIPIVGKPPRKQRSSRFVVTEKVDIEKLPHAFPTDLYRAKLNLSPEQLMPAHLTRLHATPLPITFVMSLALPRRYLSRPYSLAELRPVLRWSSDAPRQNHWRTVHVQPI